MQIQAMRAVHLPNNQDDCMVVNAARSSFGNWHDELDMTLNAKNIPKDVSLINYLAAHHHISPFFHVRFTLLISKEYFSFDKIIDPNVMMNAVVRPYNDTHYIMRHSFYGWIQLIKNSYTTANGFTSIAAALEVMTVIYTELGDKLKYSLAAYGFEPYTRTRIKGVKFVPDDYTPEYLVADFTDATVRVECPIFTARQLFTHRKADTNEISRRYISTEPTFFIPDYVYEIPEGSIKQGRGEIHPESEFVRKRMIEVTEYVANVYNELIAQKVAPEQARMILTQNMNTQIVLTASLTQWAKIIANRTDPHAQLEIQTLGHAIKDAIADESGLLVNLIEQYRWN